ncbi:MAG: hypothetical protein KC421_17480, partial [Anaerolineales bacterium]|nr:hypothetical protein [Anaerolineales bacterium]
MLQANNVPSLNLGLLPGLGGSFTTMAAGGQIERFMQYYLQAYRRAFHHIAYFSYQQEQFCNFTNDPALLSQITLYPKDKSSHYRRYALQMVRQQAQAFQACDVLRVFHTPGGIPAVQAKRRFGTPFVTTYGYKYHRFSAIEGNRLNGFLLRFAEPLILR